MPKYNNRINIVLSAICLLVLGTVAALFYFGVHSDSHAKTLSEEQRSILANFHSYYQDFSKRNARPPRSAVEMKQFYQGHDLSTVMTDRLNVKWGIALDVQFPSLLATIDEGDVMSRSILTDGTIVLHDR